MKILFISKSISDYLPDSIFHGLITLGINIVDYNKLWYMWDDAKDLDKIYGRGFSLFGTLPSNINAKIDRTDIVHKIRTRYFDYIIYGSIWRCLDLFEIVKDRYPPNRIILLDGEDYNDLHELSLSYPSFKRELIYHNTIKPIGFSIPHSKFKMYANFKDKIFATSIPGNRSTYIFNNETNYYADYSSSFYGMTIKKSGWDCMRHYEIIASCCLPYFIDLKSCPDLIMHRFPKNLVIEGEQIYLKTAPNIPNNDQYSDCLRKVIVHALNNLTTDAMAKYVLDEIRSIEK
jgi:hypothetical protein